MTGRRYLPAAVRIGTSRIKKEDGWRLEGRQTFSFVTVAAGTGVPSLDTLRIKNQESRIQDTATWLGLPR